MNEIFVAIFNRLTANIPTVPVFDHIVQDYEAWPAIQLDPLTYGEDDTGS